MIIGETSPYIKTIDTQVNANGQVVLGVYGQRLTNSAGYFQCGDVAGDLKFATGMSNTDDKLFFDISNLKPNEYCSVKLVNKSTGESNRAGFTVPASYRSPVNIFWSGGNKKVMIGIVDDRFDPKSSKDSVILGWISLNGEQKGNVIWDGYIIKDLTGTVNWNIDSLSNGPFRILGVTEGKTGNLCTSENGDCNYVLSDSFALSTDKNEE